MSIAMLWEPRKFKKRHIAIKVPFGLKIQSQPQGVGWSTLAQPFQNHNHLQRDEKLKTNEHAPSLLFFHVRLCKKPKVEIPSNLKFYKFCLKGSEIKSKGNVKTFKHGRMYLMMELCSSHALTMTFIMPKKCGTTKYQNHTGITILILVSPGTLVIYQN